MDEEGETKPSNPGPVISRRALLVKGFTGAAGLVFLPSVLAACNVWSRPTQLPQTAVPSPLPAAPTPPALPTAAPPTDFLARKLTGNLAVAGLFSDRDTLAAMTAIDAAFAGETGLTPTLNTVERGTFASTTILAVATRGDVASWYADFQFRESATQGLVVPIDDVWALVRENFPPGFARTVTGADGHVYGLPFDYYPWLFFYRKSLWQARGYEVPETWDALLALCARMEKDGLTPVAFGDKDGWPAMGTFDMLDLRLNGYDFHMGLLRGTYKWTDPRVTRVFEVWRKLVPYCPASSANITWQDATASLVKEKAGMQYLGTFISREIESSDPSGTALADIGAFPFPFFGNEFDLEKAIEAPADIWFIAAQSPTAQANLDNAKAYLQFWARSTTQLPMAKAAGMIPAARDADLSGLESFLGQAAPFVMEAQRITQFMDRDTRPDFVGALSMEKFLLSFITDPSQDLAALETTIQDFWDGLRPWG